MRDPALLWGPENKGAARCRLCSHRCRIPESGRGVCRVRVNDAGKLYTLNYGRAVSAGCDPVEKKPLYHFLPGTLTYSVAAAGCNFRCGFCQNWEISQSDGSDLLSGSLNLSPEKIVSKAISSGAQSISYTYSEPTVFFEYALDTAREGSREGLKNIFVTNGFMTPEALEMITPFLDAASVDLKFFSDNSYRDICGGRLEPVLNTLRIMKESGIRLEVTTLIIPELNDSESELSDISGFIAGLGPEVPWHISRFFPCYRFTDSPPTPSETVKKAADIGARAGLRYVYPGNVSWDTDTRCPGCGASVIRRTGYSVSEIKINPEGRCMLCGAGTDVKM